MLAEGFPQEDTKMRGLSSKLQGGGPCSTALVVLAKMGISAEYFGVLGTDFYGQYIIKDLKKYGVVTDSVRLESEGQSSNCVVLICKEKSSRTCVWAPNSLPKMEKKDVPLDKLARARFLHLDGNPVDISGYAAEKAREMGVKVSLDAGTIFPGIDGLLPLVDILIPSEEFVCRFTGISSAEEGAKKLYEEYKPEILAVTQGTLGGFFYDGKKYTRYNAFPVEVIDTNGAWDTFHGAFIAGLLKDMALTEAARFASAASAIKCSRFGAREGIPYYEETVEFVKRNGSF
jgi:ribokinase